MRILFIGDIVGRTGRKVVLEQLPDITKTHAPDVVIANGENAAGGFGITETIAGQLFDAGIDVITLGNHAFDQRETLVFIERMDNLLRPVNYPAATPGRGACLLTSATGKRVLVINVMGRIFMDPLDDPFAAIERELAACPLGEMCDAIVIDMHAETTSEKMAMGHFADGRVSLVVGTHTHVPTADHQVLSGGTAYISDVGMCGDFDSVIGMDKREPVRRFVERTPGVRFSPAEGEATLCAVMADIGEDGLARAITPLRRGGRLEPTGG